MLSCNLIHLVILVIQIKPLKNYHYALMPQLLSGITEPNEIQDLQQYLITFE